MNPILLTFMIVIVVFLLSFLLSKWMRVRKLSSLWNQYHQGLIQENANQYAAALKIYASIIQKFEKSKLASDPLLSITKERMKTLKRQMEFQNQRDFNNCFEKLNSN